MGRMVKFWVSAASRTLSFNYADRAFEGKIKYSEWVFAISVKFFPA